MKKKENGNPATQILTHNYKPPLHQQAQSIFKHQQAHFNTNNQTISTVATPFQKLENDMPSSKTAKPNILYHSKTTTISHCKHYISSKLKKSSSSQSSFKTKHSCSLRTHKFKQNNGLQ